MKRKNKREVFYLVFTEEITFYRGPGREEARRIAEFVSRNEGYAWIATVDGLFEKGQERLMNDPEFLPNEAPAIEDDYESASHGR